MKNGLAFQTQGWRELRQLKVIEVRGPDAEPWLQGQTTQDVAAIKIGQSAYSLFVTNQGKILSDAWVHRGADVFRLVVPESCLKLLLERLERYIVMEDVGVRLVDEIVVHLLGAHSKKVAQKMAAAFPCARIGEPGFDVFIPRHNKQEIEKTIAQTCAELSGAPIASEAWEAVRITNAIPEYGLDFGPENFPQESGLVQRAVSFTKGCYLGQEPVAMLQHRGKTKKHLCHLRINTVHKLHAQSELRTPQGARAGHITSAHAYAEQGYTLALGYVLRSALDAKEALHVNNAPISELRVL